MDLDFGFESELTAAEPKSLDRHLHYRRRQPWLWYHCLTNPVSPKQHAIEGQQHDNRTFCKVAVGWKGERLSKELLFTAQMKSYDNGGNIALTRGSLALTGTCSNSYPFFSFWSSLSSLKECQDPLSRSATINTLYSPIHLQIWPQAPPMSPQKLVCLPSCLHSLIFMNRDRFRKTVWNCTPGLVIPWQPALLTWTPFFFSAPCLL